jgi:hypothetical protein
MGAVTGLPQSELQKSALAQRILRRASEGERDPHQASHRGIDRLGKLKRIEGWATTKDMQASLDRLRAEAAEA